MSLVKVVSSDEEFSSILAAAPPSKLVVVDFTATWCGPCRVIKPVFGQMSIKFKHVQFLEVDVDKLKVTSQQNGVTAMPTFQFFKAGQKIAELKGAVPERLNALLEVDLSSFITRNQVDCLNQSDKHTVKSIFTKDEQYLESDCDEQLIIKNAPKSIRTFINQTSTLSFDEVDSITETERLELTESSYAENALIPLRFVKYQSVHSITIFVENNLGGNDNTIIKQLILYGSPVESTRDLSELNKPEGGPSGK
ncbi:Thioredoxin-like protein 1 [Phlyctochytrium planicorne]|nr:Thioredoxin-like protein 1 [Phlyctochytrium planicorne]